MVPETRCVNMMAQVTGAAASSFECGVDTKGYDYCTIDFCNGAAATDSVAAVFIQCSESDTQFCTNYTDGTPIVALVGAAVVSASAGFVLPTPSTCTVVPVGSNYRFNIDLRGRKRYLGVLWEVGTGGNFSIVANLSRAHVDPAMPVVAVATNSTEAYQCRLNESA